MKSAVSPPDEFDLLCRIEHPRVHIRRAGRDELPLVSEFASTLISGDLAPIHVVARVLERNPNNLLLILRRGRLVGLWAMLMLNGQGTEALLAGEFDGHDPPSRLLATPVEPPVSIYVWVILCPPLAAEGIHNVSHFLRQPLYRASNLYSRPTTEAGVKINLRRGFRPLRGTPLFRYIRLANRTSHLAAA